MLPVHGAPRTRPYDYQPRPGLRLPDWLAVVLGAAVGTALTLAVAWGLR